MTDDALIRGLQLLVDRLAPGQAIVIAGPLLGLDPDQQRYELVETNRLRLSGLLRADPRLVHEHRDELLAFIPLDSNATSQLLFPLVTALGRRPVLRHLIEAAGRGAWRHRANAASAAYWVHVGPDLPCREAVFTAVRDGTLSPADAREAMRRARAAAEPGNHDHIADLWPGFWLAAMRVFVECGDDDLRRRLTPAFPLAAVHYPPGAAPLRERAERIARAQPELFSRLLDGTPGIGFPL